MQTELTPTIAEMNEVVAKYMGYPYSAIVDIDTSECGGIYERCKVFSKVPIEVEAYPESDQYYLKDNWRYEASFEFVINPDYLYWNRLHEVWEKLREENADENLMDDYIFLQYQNIKEKIKHFIVFGTPEQCFIALYEAIKFINQLKEMELSKRPDLGYPVNNKKEVK